MQLLSFLLLLLAPGALSHQSRCLPSDTRLPFIYKSFFIKFLYATASTYIAFIFNHIERRRYFKNFHKRVFSSISKSKLSSFLTLSLSNPFQSFEEQKPTIISLQQKLLLGVLIYLQFKCTSIKSEEAFALSTASLLHHCMVIPGTVGLALEYLTYLAARQAQGQCSVHLCTV